jgi:hypothetical protein
MATTRPLYRLAKDWRLESSAGRGDHSPASASYFSHVGYEAGAYRDEL